MYRVTCRDCSWSFEADDPVEVTDEMEDHQLDEQHDLEYKGKVATDGGEELPTPSGWPYDAVVHGADVRAKCLAVTGSGDACTNNAYSDAICGMHQDANNPDLLDGAHQWARIEDGDDVIAVCVNCEAVWTGGTPPLAVDCPTCHANVGERCRDPDSVISGHLYPHPERRERARDLVDEYDYCPDAPIPPDDDDQQRLATDGGRDDDGPFFVVDEANATVLSGPFDTKDNATDDVEDRTGQLMIATRAVLQMLELASTSSLTWGPDAEEPVPDGGGDVTTWRLECMDCDYTEDVDVTDADETPPRTVEREVTRHKTQSDASHVVRVHQRPDQEDIDPSLLADGGRA